MINRRLIKSSTTGDELKSGLSSIEGLYIVSWFLSFSQIGYREKAREEASRGGSLAYRPDIALATEVSKLTSQVYQIKSVNDVLEQSCDFLTDSLQLWSHRKCFLHSFKNKMDGTVGHYYISKYQQPGHQTS